MSLRKLLAAFFLVVFSCATGHAEAQRQCKSLRIAGEGPIDIRNITPFGERFTSHFIIWNETHEHLIKAGPNGGFVGTGATHWQVENDGHRLRFFLRPDSRWSDGAPVRAADFKASLEATLEEGANGWGRATTTYKNFVGFQEFVEGQADNISGIQTDGDFELVLDFVKPNWFDLNQFTDSPLVPVPTHLSEEKRAQLVAAGTPLANGPFQVVRSDENGTVLARNPHYWDRENVYFEKVSFLPFWYSEALARYLDGEVDVILDVPTKQFDWISKNLGDQVVNRRIVNVKYISFDLRNPKLQSLPLRQAMNIAVNRPAIAEITSAGLATPLYGPMPAVDGHTPQVQYTDLTIDERLVKARRILSEAGYSLEQPIKLRLGHLDIRSSDTGLKIIQLDWKKIGVDVELVAYDGDYTDFISDFEEGKIDLASFSWWELPSSTWYLLAKFRDRSPLTSFLDDIEYDRVYGDAEVIQDLDKRIARLEAAEKYLNEKVVPDVPLFWWNGRALAKPYLTNLELAHVDGFWRSKNVGRTQEGCTN